MENNDHWSVDKRIPLAAIISGGVFVVLQTVVITAWLTTLGNRVTVLEEDRQMRGQQGEKIAVIQEKVTTLQATVNRLEEWLRHTFKP